MTRSDGTGSPKPEHKAWKRRERGRDRTPALWCTQLLGVLGYGVKAGPVQVPDPNRSMSASREQMLSIASGALRLGIP